MYQILRGGCGSKHTGAFHMERLEGLPCYVLLHVRSGGEFHIAGKNYHVLPGTVMIISPDTPYSYSNPAGDYLDDWMHFHVFPMGSFKMHFPHLNTPIPAGTTETYTTLLRQILWEQSYTSAPYAQENIDALFEIVLNHLRAALMQNEQTESSNLYTDKLRAIRLDMQCNPAGTADITACAKQLGISESYFQHIYTQLFGTSYQKDVIYFRTEHAKNLLLTTGLSMEQIAELCGYNSPVHFYRQFKKMAGETPAKFRKSNK